MEDEQNWKVGVKTRQGARKSSLDDGATRLHVADGQGRGEGKEGGRVTPASTSTPTLPRRLLHVENPPPPTPFQEGAGHCTEGQPAQSGTTSPSPDPTIPPINSVQFCSLH